jgi:hypothetical protein
MSEEVIEPVVQTPQEPAVQTPEEPTTQTTNYAELLNADGTFKDEFYQKLPDRLGEHGSVKKYKSVVDLIKGNVNAASLIGKKAEDFWKSDDPELVKQRRAIMGVPDSADGYELAIPDMPENTGFTEEEVSGFKTVAAELGLSKEQAQKLVEWQAAQVASGVEQMQAQASATREEAETALKKDWGSKYEYNLGKVKQVADFLGITEVLDRTGLGNEPTLLKALLDRVAPAVSEDKLIETAKADNFATLSDQLDSLDSWMINFTGSPHSPEYRAKLKEKETLLQKMT